VSVALYWPDGTALPGEDATDVLARLGRLQWQPLEVAAMKAALSDRAWALLGVPLNPSLPDDEFLTALDASGLCAVVYGGTPVKPSQKMRGRPAGWEHQ
jgi:hypothetical protein